MYFNFGGEPVLEDLSLTLPAEGALAITGPSGRGKTTLLRLLAGVITPCAGQISGLAGLKVSVAFQEDRLLPWRTALENITAVLPGRDKAADRDCAAQWLAKMELLDAKDAYPAALSGGMRQRVALARACAYGGALLLLDEPFQGLDNALRARVAQIIHTAAPSIVLVTHDLEEAALIGADIVRL